jgi:cell division protein FtsB
MRPAGRAPRKIAKEVRGMTDVHDKTPQEQIKEGMWRIALQTVVVLSAMAFGVLIGHILWGDAPELKQQVTARDQQITELKNEREAQAGAQALCERDKEDFKKRMDKVFDKNNELQREVADLKQRFGVQ